ncbi:hypothetical protein IW261DRAFT_1557108 [Armillaria novae-zelandiae]|uniref:DUF6533 domain-containing protein n=1 Tax=Armillaria novae-zelandiae TaxID=153914 RepID=A0AA39UM32_9AGAR|nr:hypothetical protein IW261DRAFT_1557108 [Armillaria novae-zelandiae]
MATKAAVTHFLQFRIQYSSIALLYYDYALTFPTEVKYMWHSKFKWSTALYICCRYALIANVLYLLAIAKKLGARVLPFLSPLFTLLTFNVSNCDTWYKIIGALSVIGRAAVIATFTARTYVIFAKSNIILTYLVAIGLACVILDIVAPAGFFQRLLNALTLPLSGILTARFLLHLRVWKDQHSTAVVSGNRGIVSQQTQTMEFRALSVIDEFGEDPVSVSARQDGYTLEENPQKTDQENLPSTSTMVPATLESSTRSTAYNEKSR